VAMRRRPHLLLMPDSDFVFQKMRIQLSMDEAAARDLYHRHQWLLMMSARRIKAVHRVLLGELGGWQETADAVKRQPRLLRVKPKVLKATLQTLKQVGLEGDPLVTAVNALSVRELHWDRLRVLEVRW
jgi:hypothetical protein